MGQPYRPYKPLRTPSSHLPVRVVAKVKVKVKSEAVDVVKVKVKVKVKDAAVAVAVGAGGAAGEATGLPSTFFRYALHFIPYFP